MHNKIVFATDVETYSVAASRVAATCLFKARGRLRLVPVWPESLRKYTQYAQQDLEQTAILITGSVHLILLLNASKSTLKEK